MEEQEDCQVVVVAVLETAMILPVLLVAWVDVAKLGFGVSDA